MPEPYSFSIQWAQTTFLRNTFQIAMCQNYGYSKSHKKESNTLLHWYIPGLQPCSVLTNNSCISPWFGPIPTYILSSERLYITTSSFAFFICFSYTDCPLNHLYEQSDARCWTGSTLWEVWWNFVFCSGHSHMQISRLGNENHWFSCCFSQSGSACLVSLCSYL